MASTILRPARPDDAARLGRLHVDCWLDAYRGMMPDPVLDGLSVEERIDRWSKLLSRPPAFGGTWLACVDGVDVGFVSVGPARDADSTAEIYALYLLAKSWGTGLGRRMLEMAIDALGATRRPLTLWVLDDNLRARRFYERAGFTMDGKRRIDSIAGFPLPHTRYLGPGNPDEIA